MTERRSDHSRKLHELRLRAEQLHRLGPAELPRRGGNREGNGLLGVAVVRGYLNPVDRISAAGPELSVETVARRSTKASPRGSPATERKRTKGATITTIAARNPTMTKEAV